VLPLLALLAGIALTFAASVPLLLVGSRALVGSTVDLSRALGIPTISLSIILVPLATALPETLSSMIWAFRGRDTLAVGALVGEAVMFSTVYPALGILLTDWALNAAAMFSVAATELASTVILWRVRSGRLGPISAAVGLAAAPHLPQRVRDPHAGELEVPYPQLLEGRERVRPESPGHDQLHPLVHEPLDGLDPGPPGGRGPGVGDRPHAQDLAAVPVHDHEVLRAPELRAHDGVQPPVLIDREGYPHGRDLLGLMMTGL
jgi:hypothetical protein